MGQEPQATRPVNLRALELLREATSKVTQDELASRTGIPRSTLANMLSPTGRPRIVHVEQLVRIAAAVGADPCVWLEDLERVRRALERDDLAKARASRASATQKRAARKANKPRPGD